MAKNIEIWKNLRNNSVVRSREPTRSSTKDSQAMISYKKFSYFEAKETTRYCISTQCIPQRDMVEASHTEYYVYSELSVKISPKRPKMASVRYFGGLWMTFNEELQGQISACLHICRVRNKKIALSYWTF